jgi:hypothetical protein
MLPCTCLRNNTFLAYSSGKKDLTRLGVSIQITGGGKANAYLSYGIVDLVRTSVISFQRRSAAGCIITGESSQILSLQPDSCASSLLG